MDWQPDILGPGFSRRPLHLPGGSTATLVRSEAELGPQRFLENTAVLHIHGWSDYFYNRALAQLWADFGAHFYAVDLRDYGRNLRPGDPEQRPGYIEDLAEYAEEIETAFAVIEAAHPQARLVLSAHSTGGLAAVLWASRNPGQVTALALNSPWLEFQYSATARRIATPFLRASARAERAPRPLPLVFPAFYVRAASENHGAPPYDLALKPPHSFPVYGPWLRAVFNGHKLVEKGLGLADPVLVQVSHESYRAPAYSSRMAHSDIVLDVDAIAKRTLRLGDTVVLCRVPGAVHDVYLSGAEAFAHAAGQLRRFARGYCT